MQKKYKYKRRVGPVIEPVSLADMKLFLKVDTSDDDVLISDMITAAREYCENLTGRLFISQEWSVFLNHWSDNIQITKGPVISLEGINIYDGDNQKTAFDTSKTITDIQENSAEISLKNNALAPVALKSQNSIEIQYTGGYGANADDVPRAIVEVIKQMVAYWHEYRGLTSDKVAQKIGLHQILQPYKLMDL